MVHLSKLVFAKNRDLLAGNDADEKSESVQAVKKC